MTKKEKNDFRIILSALEKFLKEKDSEAFTKEIEKMKTYFNILEEAEYKEALNFYSKATNKNIFNKEQEILLKLLKTLAEKFPEDEKSKEKEERELLKIVRELANSGNTSRIIDEDASKKSLNSIDKDLREYYSDFFTLKAKEIKGNIFYFKIKEGSLKEEIKEFFNEDYKEIISLFSNLQKGKEDDEYSEALKSITKKDKEIFTYKSLEFEHLSNEKVRENLRILKKILENDNFAKIEYFENGKIKTYAKLRCIKLIYSDNNWYLAAEVKKEIKLFKLSFIKKVDNLEESQNFQKKVLENYNEKLKNMQNSQSLFSDFEKKKVLLRARFAFYFEEGMKPFFPSQKFLRKNKDGSVDFEITYSQASEVLPFIKKWLPSLEILSSPDSELEQLLNADIELALQALEEL